MPRVIAVPVLVQSQYDSYLMAIHCTPSIHLCTSGGWKTEGIEEFLHKEKINDKQTLNNDEQRLANGF